MKKKKFYLFAPAKEHFDYRGISLGMGNDRKIYYPKSVGKHRAYRSDANNPAKGLTLMTFSSKESAQKVADYTNENFNDNFEVREIE